MAPQLLWNRLTPTVLSCTVLCYTVLNCLPWSFAASSGVREKLSDQVLAAHKHSIPGSSPYDEMYKAISVLRELFFPQWIQQLKDENIIDISDDATTPRPTTAFTPSTAATRRLSPSSTTLRSTTATTSTWSAVLQSTLQAETVAPTSQLSTAAISQDNLTTFSSADELYISTADTLVKIIQNITYLPVVTFPFPDFGINFTEYSDVTVGCPNGNFSGNCSTTAVELERNYWALFLLLFPILTIFGNTLVILSVFRERSLQTATNYFIVSLAFADLLVASVVMPFAVYIEVNGNQWDLGDSICDTWIASDVIGSTCSIFNLTAISIDRFIAVTKPIKYARHKNHKRVVWTICIVWFVSCAIGIPIMIGFNVPGTDTRSPNLCIFYNSDFIIYSSLTSFYIPCLLMIVLYYQIFRAIRQRAKKQTASHKAHGHKPSTASVTQLSDIKQNQLNPIPLVDTHWNNNNNNNCTKGGAIGASPNMLHKSNSLPEGQTNVSSSFLVDQEDIEDIDVDSGQQSTPPQLNALSPSESDGPKDTDRTGDFLDQLNNCASVDEVLMSPDIEVPGKKKKRARFMAALNAATQSKPQLENGGTTLLEANHVKKTHKAKNHRRSMKTREKLLAKRERKATKTLAIVLGVFLVCWVPFFTANMINAICDKLDIPMSGTTVFMLTTWVGYGNSFMNPVIYTVFNEEFRKAFLNILRCRTKFN